ncbi:MAG: Asp-tRNA(Asn)/Glu-tRNA(Gln) amidotransferase subunit GatC [Cellvibrionaceae bacterium]|nr:Asp-tRNA(Asn)/Glu-tRNA(Gln) amidotransferase subunit GatC [Cellvibrionaceae bacterium]
MEPSEIEKLADLARLEITADTVNETAKSINEVLALVDQLKSADTDNVQPMSHPLDVTQVLRPDQVTESCQREKLLESAPATERGLFLVPKVIE